MPVRQSVRTLPIYSKIQVPIQYTEGRQPMFGHAFSQTASTREIRAFAYGQNDSVAAKLAGWGANSVINEWHTNMKQGGMLPYAAAGRFKSLALEPMQDLQRPIFAGVPNADAVTTWNPATPTHQQTPDAKTREVWSYSWRAFLEAYQIGVRRGQSGEIDWLPKGSLLSPGKGFVDGRASGLQGARFNFDDAYEWPAGQAGLEVVFKLFNDLATPPVDPTNGGSLTGNPGAGWRSALGYPAATASPPTDIVLGTLVVQAILFGERVGEEIV